MWYKCRLNKFLIKFNVLNMNELDAIQQQMAALGIDVWATPEQSIPSWDPTLSEEDIAMFWPGGQYAIEEEVVEESPIEEEMPAYDIEELKIDIQPMLQWLPKDEFANLIIWMSAQYDILNQNNL